MRPVDPSRRSRVADGMRQTLVISSVGLHIAVVTGFFVAGVWQLDRLEAGKRPFDLAVATPPPPAASGSPAATKAEPFKRKQPRTVTREIVVPQKHHDDELVAKATEPGDGTGGTGSGAGSGSGFDPTGTGTCAIPPCGGDPAPAAPPKQVPPTPILVPPTVIKGLRTNGETQIHPPDPVKTAMYRDGKTQVVSTIRLCVGTDGEVSGITFLKSSGYAGYDAALDDGLRRWHYRAYEVNGKKVPVCGVVTFIYAIK